MTETAADGGETPPDLKKTRRKKAGFSDNTARTDRLPPHSPEAEQGVIGCIMLSPNDCVGECVEKFKAGSEVFYDLRHRTIYELLVEMFDKRDPIDIITLQQRLKDKQQLDQVGGLAYLAALPDTVPSAANLAYYLEIVHEKFVLRRLIQTCTEVVGRVYDNDGEVDTLLDEVERDILRISEERVEGKTDKIKDLVKKAISTIEDYHQRQGMLTGVGTGFAEMDKMTSGLHGGEMIVIAARPSMGKCLSFDTEVVLGDGSVASMAEIHARKSANLATLLPDFTFGRANPSDYVDDGRKPVFRVTTRSGRRVETTWTHPFLKPAGWFPLGELKVGDAVAVPRRLEIFGNEEARECELKLLAYLIGDGCLTDSAPTFANPNAAVREDFASAVNGFRGIRIKAIDADAEGGRRDEARDPFPGFAVWRVVGEPDAPTQRSPAASRMVMAGGERGAAQEWENPGWASDENSDAAWRGQGANPISHWLEELGLAGKEAEARFIPPHVFRLARKQMALFLGRLLAGDGWASIRRDGWVQIGYSTVSERLARQVQHLLLRFGIIGVLRRTVFLDHDTRRTSWQVEITDPESIETFAREVGIFGKERAVNAVRERVRLVPQLPSSGVDYSGDICWDPIVAIEPLGMKQVYDLTIPETHNFVANDICVHNTSLAMNIAEAVAIEQKLPVGVFSLEMTSASLVLRMLCSRSRVNLRNVREGFLAERDFPKLTGAAGKLANAPLFIDDTSGMSILQLRAKARRMSQQYGIKLFVIDYLQLLHSTARRAENRQQEIADISSGVKSLAKELDVPVIVLSQLNRELEKDKDRKPRLSDLRESGAIEQDADLVCLLYKPSREDDEGGGGEEQDAVPVNLFIAKQRNGPTGDVQLTFLKSYTRFESRAKVSDADVP